MMIKSDMVITFGTIDSGNKVFAKENSETWKLITDMMIAVSAPRFRNRTRGGIKFNFKTIKKSEIGDKSPIGMPIPINQKHK